MSIFVLLGLIVNGLLWVRMSTIVLVISSLVDELTAWLLDTGRVADVDISSVTVGQDDSVFESEDVVDDDTL